MNSLLVQCEMEESHCQQLQKLEHVKEDKETELELLPSPSEARFTGVDFKEEEDVLSSQYSLAAECVKEEPECVQMLSCSDIAKCEMNETLASPYTDIIKDELFKQSLCTECNVSELTCLHTNMIKYEHVLTPEHVIEKCISEAAMADLYSDHAVKDEVLLGPEQPHRPDVDLAVRSWALPDAGSWSATPAAVRVRLKQPKGCSVRLERLPSHAAIQTKDTTTHAGTKPDNEKKYTSRQSICGFCGEAFTLKADVIKHVMRHIHIPTSMEEEERLLSNYEKLRSSIRDCWVKLERCDSANHKPAKTVIPSKEKETVLQQKIHMAGTNDFICDICCKAFQEKRSLVGHIKKHLQRSHMLLNKKTLTAKLDIHEYKRRKPYTCEICNKVFRLHRELMRHERTHSGQKPYSCVICFKRFARIDYIKLHTETVHKNVEYKFSCEICQKKFKHLPYLEKHKLIHTKRQLYYCNICNKQFIGLNHFKKHTLINVERKHQCHVCYKKFTFAACLTRHQRVHDGLRPYSCEICSKTFSLAHTLKSHLRTHTGQKPYECNICKKRFTQLAGLKSHTRIHEGVKRYNCEICSKSFMHLGSLNRHKLTHIGEKKHICEICDRRFFLPYPLKLHMKTHMR